MPRSFFVTHSTNARSWRKTLEPIDGSYEKVFPASKKRKFVEEQIFSGGEFLIEIFSQSLLRNRERSSNDFQMVRVVRIVPEKSDKFLKVQLEKEEQHKN